MGLSKKDFEKLPDSHYFTPKMKEDFKKHGKIVSVWIFKKSELGNHIVIQKRIKRSVSFWTIEWNGKLVKEAAGNIYTSSHMKWAIDRVAAIVNVNLWRQWAGVSSPAPREDVQVGIGMGRVVREGAVVPRSLRAIQEACYAFFREWPLCEYEDRNELWAASLRSKNDGRKYRGRTKEEALLAMLSSEIVQLEEVYENKYYESKV